MVASSIVLVFGYAHGSCYRRSEKVLSSGAKVNYCPSKIFNSEESDFSEPEDLGEYLPKKEYGCSIGINGDLPSSSHAFINSKNDASELFDFVMNIKKRQLIVFDNETRQFVIFSAHGLEKCMSLPKSFDFFKDGDVVQKEYFYQTSTLAGLPHNLFVETFGKLPERGYEEFYNYCNADILETVEVVESFKDLKIIAINTETGRSIVIDGNQNYFNYDTLGRLQSALESKKFSDYAILPLTEYYFQKLTNALVEVKKEKKLALSGVDYNSFSYKHPHISSLIKNSKIVRECASNLSKKIFPYAIRGSLLYGAGVFFKRSVEFLVPLWDQRLELAANKFKDLVKETTGATSVSLNCLGGVSFNHDDRTTTAVKKAIDAAGSLGETAISLWSPHGIYFAISKGITSGLATVRNWFKY